MRSRPQRVALPFALRAASTSVMIGTPCGVATDGIRYRWEVGCPGDGRPPRLPTGPFDTVLRTARVAWPRRRYLPGMPDATPPDDDLPFEIRASPVQGLGAFATRPIPAGTRLIEYAGERITPAESDRRYPEPPGERHHTFLFAIDDDVVIDAAVDGNAARFINHSCDPNCDAVIEDGRIWIETVRDVDAGEELAYDYAYVLEERHTPAAKRRFPCHCGAATCRGTILAKKR